MEQQDRDQASEYDMPEDEREKMPEQYGTVSLDDFAKYSMSMFEYWTEDKEQVKEEFEATLKHMVQEF